MSESEESLTLRMKMVTSGMSLVRVNLMTREGYSPYCGDGFDTYCSLPRSRFTGTQFKCPECGWESDFPEEFINEYKAKWSKP